MLRVARMFRLIQSNKELLNMFKTLMLSLPAIVNVAAVTLLQFFVYAVLGMNLFAHIKHQGAIKPHANFDGFWNSMFLLFRMSTGESYNGLMHDAMVTGDDCRPGQKDWWAPVGQCTIELPSNCGSPGGAPLFFLSFFIFSSLLLLNLLVAIILDNFEGVITNDTSPVQDEDLKLFKHAWSEFDCAATGFLARRRVEPGSSFCHLIDERARVCRMVCYKCTGCGKTAADRFRHGDEDHRL